MTSVQSSNCASFQRAWPVESANSRKSTCQSIPSERAIEIHREAIGKILLSSPLWWSINEKTRVDKIHEDGLQVAVADDRRAFEFSWFVLYFCYEYSLSIPPPARSERLVAQIRRWTYRNPLPFFLLHPPPGSKTPNAANVPSGEKEKEREKGKERHTQTSDRRFSRPGFFIGKNFAVLATTLRHDDR